MSSDYFDSDNYLVTRQKALEDHLNNISIATDAGFKKLPQPRTDSGSANAYVVTIADSPTVSTDGYRVILKPANANTGASTLNVNGEGAIPIILDDGTPLSGGELQAGHYYHLTRNGSTWEMVASAIPDSSITSDKFKTNGTRSDGYVVAWNAAAGADEWVANGSGSDTGQVRMVDAASPMAFLGDVLGSNLSVDASGDLIVHGDALSEDLLINADARVNQISYTSGAALAVGDYLYDMWKCTAAGTVTFTSGGNITLSAGTTIAQKNDDIIYEDGTEVTVFVESGSVTVDGLGIAAATVISPGSPHTFTIDTATSEWFGIGSASAETFSGLHLVRGGSATSVRRPGITELELMCYRYLFPLNPGAPGSIINNPSALATGAFSGSAVQGAHVKISLPLRLSTSGGLSLYTTLTSGTISISGGKNSSYLPSGTIAFNDLFSMYADWEAVFDAATMSPSATGFSWEVYRGSVNSGFTSGSDIIDFTYNLLYANDNTMLVDLFIDSASGGSAGIYESFDTITFEPGLYIDARP